MSVKGHRRPPPVPALSKMSMEQGMREIEKWLRALSADASGLPPTHSETHLVTGTDPLATPGLPTSVTVNIGASVGDGPAFALEDHQHGLDLGLTTKGDLLTRTASGYARLPVDAQDGVPLVSNSSAPEGLSWGDSDQTYSAEFVAWLALMGWGA